MKKQAFSLIELSIVILIIGILVAGVTQSSRLVTEFRLNSARTLTQSAPVTSIKDLVLWLEPTMEGAITSATNGANPENGDAVSAWNDYNPQAIRKNTLIQATSGNRPTYTTNVIGGLPALFFNNGNYLESTTAPIALGGLQYTYFVVWQSSNSTGVQVIFHQRATSSCAGDRLGIFTSGANLSTWACGTGDWLVGTHTVNSPNATVFRLNNNLASNNGTIYLNGVKTGPSTRTGYTTLGASAIALGWSGDSSPTYYFRGYVSELIIFERALKDAEIDDIRAYLSKKYKISA